MRWPRALMFLLLFSLGSGCASTSVPVLKTTDSQETLLEDEKEIWDRADRFENRLATQEFVISSGPLNDYLLDVLKKLIAARSLSKELIEPRIYILETAETNAFVIPNGAVYVTSSLITRMDNDAQVATLLSHELVHFIHRHSLLRSRKQQNAQRWGGLMNILVAAGTGVASSGVGDSLQLSMLGSYSREQEREADIEGLQLMVDAGYNPHSAPALFTLLRDRTIDKEQSSFSSHPKLNERLASYKELLSSNYIDVTGDENSAPLLRLVKPLSYEVTMKEIDVGYYAAARKSLDIIKSRYGENGHTIYLEYELQKQDTDSTVGKVELDELLLESVIDGSAPYNAYREAGFLYRSRDDQTNASSMFRKYLDLKPDASDALIIRGFIE